MNDLEPQTAFDRVMGYIKGDEDAFARGFAAGLEQAAGVCDERAMDLATDGVNHPDGPYADLSIEAECCAAAIRALAAPPAAGVDDGGKVDA